MFYTHSIHITIFYKIYDVFRQICMRKKYQTAIFGNKIILTGYDVTCIKKRLTVQTLVFIISQYIV